MKLLSKDFEFETFDKFGISKLFCEVSHNDTIYTITISDNNCDARFRVCEFENEEIDSDILELFENADFYDDLVKFAEDSKDEYLDKLLTDFENKFDSKYELEHKDNIYLSDYQKQIFKSKEDDYILKIKHISDNNEDGYYSISQDDFEISDNDDDNIVIDINECFDFDSNIITIFEIEKL